MTLLTWKYLLLRWWQRRGADASGLGSSAAASGHWCGGCRGQLGECRDGKGMLRWAAEAMGSSAAVWEPPPGKSPLKRTEITSEPSRRHCRSEAASETAALGHRGQAASARTRIFIPVTEFRQLPAGSRGVPAGDGEPRPAGSSTRPPCAFPGAAGAGTAAAGGRREGLPRPPLLSVPLERLAPRG